MTPSPPAPRTTAALTPETRVRVNSTLSPTTIQLIDDKAMEWGVSKGEAMDRLVASAVGSEVVSRQAEVGSEVLEETLRRLLGEAQLAQAATIRALLDERLELPAIEISTTRLLLFALLVATRGEGAAVSNEDEALRVARAGRVSRTLPLLLRRKPPHV